MFRVVSPSLACLLPAETHFFTGLLDMDAPHLGTRVVVFMSKMYIYLMLLNSLLCVTFVPPNAELARFIFILFSEGFFRLPGRVNRHCSCFKSLFYSQYFMETLGS